MTNTNPTPADITAAAIALHYDDITSRALLLDFARDISASPSHRDALIAAIDLDLNDMLHNSNLDFYLPLDDLDALTDDDFDALADLLLARTDPAMIADALLARFPA